MTEAPGNSAHDVLLGQFEKLGPVRAAVIGVVNFDLPESTHAKFEQIAEIARREPPELARLRPEDEKSKNWYQAFFNGIGYLKDGLSASYFHLDNIEGLEAEVLRRCGEALSELDPPDEPVTMAMRTPRIDYESEAFRFALRRTLEYLAVTLAAFFKAEPSSIRKLRKALKKQTTRSLRST
jgi:hypothetical protein